MPEDDRVSQILDSARNYWSLPAELKFRWHLLHGCTCGYLEYEEFHNPWGHHGECPMSDPNDESWLYLSYYDCIPN